MSLELRGIRFRYPRATTDLLAGIDLTVADGETVALMAPSGAGKSTLLAIAGLLLRPDSGEVLLDGHPIHTRRGRDHLGSRISWVLQSVNLLPRRSVLDNTVLPAVLQGQRRSIAEDRASELLSTLGLHDKEHREARSLSGGEAQRVGVARALITGPRILIADEPTANLDRATAQVVATGLLNAAGQTSVLLATHDPVVAGMADRVIEL